MRIALSAGHYPEAKGAYNETHHIAEHDVCVDIVEGVYRIFASLREHVLIVPAGPLRKKVEWINKENPDCVVEVHLNGASGDAHGTECLYYPGSLGGLMLATEIQARLVRALGLRDRGIKERHNLYLLKHTTMPAVITESLFLTNDDEVKSILLDPISLDGGLVQAHAHGIMAYMSQLNDAEEI